MPKAVKSYAVDISRTSTTSTTVYTCPAATTAKVIISSLLVGVTYDSAAAKLVIGLVTYAASASTDVTLNTGISAGGAVTHAPPIELHLTAGQTILAVTTVNIGSSAKATIKAQICVIEVES